MQALPGKKGRTKEGKGPCGRPVWMRGCLEALEVRRHVAVLPPCNRKEEKGGPARRRSGRAQRPRSNGRRCHLQDAWSVRQCCLVLKACAPLLLERAAAPRGAAAAAGRRARGVGRRDDEAGLDNEQEEEEEEEEEEGGGGDGAARALLRDACAAVLRVTTSPRLGDLWCAPSPTPSAHAGDSGREASVAWPSPCLPCWRVIGDSGTRRRMRRWRRCTRCTPRPTR